MRSSSGSHALLLPCSFPLHVSELPDPTRLWVERRVTQPMQKRARRYVKAMQLPDVPHSRWEQPKAAAFVDARVFARLSMALKALGSMCCKWIHGIQRSSRCYPPVSDTYSDPFCSAIGLCATVVFCVWEEMTTDWFRPLRRDEACSS